MSVRAVRARAARAALKPRSVISEHLESRQLLAIINVTSHGATPNNGGNDITGINAAIAASNDWDTIYFPAGTYDLPFGGGTGNGIKLKGKRIYLGERDGNGNPLARIKGVSTEGPILWVKNNEPNAAYTGNDITLTGFIFDGGGIFIEKNGGKNTNIVIDYNRFELNIPGGKVHRDGINFSAGLQNSRITNNYITNYTGIFGIWGYNYTNLTIANNEFVNLNAAMHIDGSNPTGNANLLVEQNYMVGIKGMGMEFQSHVNGAIFQDNWYEHPNLSTNYNQNLNSFAYSLILDKSSNITIQRNVVYTLLPNGQVFRPDGTGVRVGFEVGGDNTLVEDNYINGVNHTVAMNDGVGTASVIARNNQFLNYLKGPSNTFPSSNPLRTFQNINNGPNTVLSATMRARLQAMQKPGIGPKRYGPPLPEPPPPPPDEPDPQVPPLAPSGLSGSNFGSGSLTLTWFDNAENETGFIVQRFSTDGQTWENLTVTPLGANTTQYQVTGLVSGQDYSFRVIAQNQYGMSNPSNVITITQPPNVPSNLTGITVGTSQINLSWTDTSSNEEGFMVQMLAEDGSSWNTIGITGVNQTTFVIAGLASGKSYSFQVVAFNAGGGVTSGASNVATVSTPLPDIGTTSTALHRPTRPAFIYQGTALSSLNTGAS